MSRSPDFEARREKREFVVFNWIAGKICGWNVGNFQWKMTKQDRKYECGWGAWSFP
jgi:hypothetical protein